MKKINLSTYFTLVIAIFLIATSCNKEVTDFGFDGSLSGKVVDQNGNIVAGDVTSAGLVVYAAGENDNIPMVMRVLGDGTYANTKLYPQVYTLYVEGSIVSSQEYTIDLTKNKSVTQDFVVTPFLSCNTPALNGSATSSEIKINYSIIENDDYTARFKEIYCSTVPYPNRTTGSGPYYDTKKATLTDLQGTVTITDLSSNTKYFIRLGAKADGSTAFNFSEQIIVSTP